MVSRVIEFSKIQQTHANGGGDANGNQAREKISN